MYAIPTFEFWQIIGFNKDSTQQKLCSAHSERELMKQWDKLKAKQESLGVHSTLGTYKVVKMWNVDKGFVGGDIRVNP